MSAKPCKYGCGTSITWDAKNSRFIEADGTPHTKERCESLRAKTTPTPKPAETKGHKVHAIISLTTSQYHVPRKLCEASAQTEAEYIQAYLLDIMRSHLDIFFPNHADREELKRKLEEE